MENIYYVYALIDPRTDMPFYVGKGKNNRMFNHLKEKTSGVKKNNKIFEIREAGFEPIAIKLLENLSEDNAYKSEEDIIKSLGRTGIEENGILTNNRLRAWAPVMTLEVRNAISNWRKGMTFTSEHRTNLSKAREGKTYEEIYGVDGAKKRRDQLSQKRGPMPEECRKNISKAKKGMGSPHTWSDESRKKLSETTKGIPKPFSKEEKEKRSMKYKEIIECPHCLIKGCGLSMIRWHFNNCKKKNP